MSQPPSAGPPLVKLLNEDLAPEMVKKKGVTKSADIYGIGCVLYELLTGEPAFMDDEMDKLTKKIESGKILFPQYVSDDAKRVVKVNILLKGPVGQEPHQPTKVLRHH
jgi:serine/threonine protein kinase